MANLAIPSIRIGMMSFKEAILICVHHPRGLKIQSRRFSSTNLQHLAGSKRNLPRKQIMSSYSSLTTNISAKPLEKSSSADNIVWVDCEMTGLDPEKDHVLEIACLVTDGQLNIIAEGPDITIYQPPEVLSRMNEWSLKQHKESGLTEQCKQSKVTLHEAEKQLLDFVREWTPYKKCPLGGNTIYVDRLFLKKHMPSFEEHLHYRIVDVSSLKELCSRWYPDVYRLQPNKKEISTHRAMGDIKNSIQELLFYKDRVFMKPSSESCAFE